MQPYHCGEYPKVKDLLKSRANAVNSITMDVSPADLRVMSLSSACREALGTDEDKNSRNPPRILHKSNTQSKVAYRAVCLKYVDN